MQSNRLVYLFLLNLLTNVLFSQSDESSPITDKYNLEVTDFSANLKYNPKTIFNIYEYSLGILWLLGSEEEPIIFNSKAETKVWKFDGYQFVSFELPEDIRNSSYSLKTILEFDQ